MFEHGVRGTGRTTRTIDRLKHDDMLVVRTTQEASRLKQELRARRLQVTVHVGRTREDIIRLMANRGGSRLIIDHTVVLALYLEAVEETARFLARVEEVSAGDHTNLQTKPRPMRGDRYV
jgi:hypothetical protein